MIPTQRKHSETPKSLKLEDIAKLVGGKVVGDPALLITGVAGIKEAGEGDITFIANVKYLPFLAQTRAAAVICSPDVASDEKSLVLTQNPSQAFTQVISLFNPVFSGNAGGIHSLAVIHDSAVLGAGVSVGPYAVIEQGCVVGDFSVIGASTYIGAACRIGSQTLIYPHVTIREGTQLGDRVIIHSGTVIGSDGFGYEQVDGKHIKIPQTGIVVIEDEVEIGANVCVDRGRFQKTWIKQGTKIDNLVQIAHNVVIGEHSLVISQAGISGSTELGNHVVIAGQAGLVGHITLGDWVIVGAGAGVTKSFPAKSIVLGQPARPIQEQKKILAMVARLPDLFKELASLKKKVK